MVAASELTFKKVKVSDKGQISIPMDLQREMGIGKGDELLLVRKGRRIVLEKPARVLELLEDEFADLQALTEEGLERLWLNRNDEVWNKYLKARRK
jgi:AbrB family looped-hinge helix DNA binding protein